MAYVGSQTRHLLQTLNLNIVPYGARFDPANQDPTRPGNPLPDNFFRPYPGYGDINFFLNNGIANYNALQVQANRRFAQGLQFGVAYTLSRSRDYTSATETGTTPGRLPTYSEVRDWTYGLSSFDQTHVAVINYTWELPKASARWNNAVMRAVLDNWQMSGITAFASGTPSGVTLALVDSATDMTGGGDGTRVVVTGDPSLSRERPSFTQWFDTSVFARPPRGDVGNGHKDIIRLPGVEQHRRDAVQADPVQRRAAQRPAPLGGLQPVQPHAVQRRGHDRAVRRRRRPGEPDVRPGDLDPFAPRDAGRGADRVLRGAQFGRPSPSKASQEREDGRTGRSTNTFVPPHLPSSCEGLGSEP